MPAGWALTPADRNLLAALAAEAGLAFRNLRLTAELRRQLERLSATAAELAASRRRIVTAQDEERRRLGRDLRRGPQRRLDGIAGRLGPAGDALAEDPARAAALLSELTGEANLALESLRDLARGVFPPLLGEQGLPAALRALARASGPATVTVGPGVDGRRFPPPVEAAVYFCCREAMGAGSEALELSVSGVGDAGSLPLRQMADRVEALDGTLALDGTGLRARVPLAHGAAPARGG
jgi:signal transduction histidine kinase